MSSVARKLATYDDLVALPPEVSAEIVDGAVAVQPSASFQHGEIAADLAGEVRARRPRADSAAEDGRTAVHVERDPRRRTPPTPLAAVRGVRHARRVQLARMPGWIVDNATSVRREAEPYRSMTPAERWEITQRCCRAAHALLQRSPHAERALAHVDPLPPSTVEALARLRASR